MRSSMASRRYSRALFNLAKDQGQMAEIRADLAALRKLIDDVPQLRDALMRPLHPAKERKAVVDAVAERIGTGRVVRHFVAFLIDQRRLLDFGVIQDEFERLANEASGLVTAQVVAASPLGDRQQDRLRRTLADRTGRQIKLDIRLDPKLIGGAIATVGDTVFDGSLRTQLERLRANLTKGS